METSVSNDTAGLPPGSTRRGDRAFSIALNPSRWKSSFTRARTTTTTKTTRTRTREQSRKEEEKNAAETRPFSMIVAETPAFPDRNLLTITTTITIATRRRRRRRWRNLATTNCESEANCEANRSRSPVRFPWRFLGDKRFFEKRAGSGYPRFFGANERTISTVPSREVRSLFSLGAALRNGKSIVVRVLLNYVELIEQRALDMERAQFRLEGALECYTFRRVVTFVPFSRFSHFLSNSYELRARDIDATNSGRLISTLTRSLGVFTRAATPFRGPRRSVEKKMREREHIARRESEVNP